MDVLVDEPPPAEPELRGALFAELLLRGLSCMVRPGTTTPTPPPTRTLRPGHRLPGCRIWQVPGLGSAYLSDDGGMSARVSIDGGYYTQTPDNLPLIGPVPHGPSGSFVCAGLSGYGVMAANAAGELIGSHVVGEGMPEHARAYAEAFLPERWERREYRESVYSGDVGKGLQI